jgi:hypothetical protein
MAATAVIGAEVARRLGDGPITATMTAYVFEARIPSAPPDYR